MNKDVHTLMFGNLSHCKYPHADPTKLIQKQVVHTSPSFLSTECVCDVQLYDWVLCSKVYFLVDRYCDLPDAHQSLTSDKNPYRRRNAVSLASFSPCENCAHDKGLSVSVNSHLLLLTEVHL